MSDRLGPARNLAGRLARNLPGPRGAAAIGLARDAKVLVTGHGQGSTNLEPGDPAVSPIALIRARRALGRGDDEAALGLADRILAEHPDSVAALAVRRTVMGHRGELTAALEAIRAMRGLRDTSALEQDERDVAGRLRETDPHWLPRVAGRPRPVTASADGRVMHLLKESLPQRSNGYTIRSRYSLLAEREAGLDPFVVTALGFPRSVGASDWTAVETVDGIAHHRLDLGPAWPPRTPVDEVLTQTAWLASRIGERERPAIINAGSGNRGYDAALVGLALREHLGIPLVYEARSFLETTWTTDERLAETAELTRRRDTAERRAMLAADGVITIGEAMRDDLIGRGVPADRISVVPNGVDPIAFAPLDPDPELRRSYGLEGKAVVGYVSTMDVAREGQEILIEATARLVRAGRAVACLLVGDGERRPELEALARKAGIGGSVVFTGRVPHADVRRLYPLIDVFVVPRIDDRAARLVTPLKPFEAMAMGRPLVVADLPALLEIAAPDLRGLSFPTGDAEALAAVLGDLLDQPELQTRLGEAGRAWVLAERTWTANGPRYRSAYEAAQRTYHERAAGSAVLAAR